ncbi:hypothetical protein KGQ34_04800, partial [Patescibacteria group bacterium]|nr:hypothetical protein [Patescibacteria group bacterium]
KDGSLQSSLIFLDPDNGFEVQKSDEKHLLYKEAENLCTRMGKDSVIAVIQFFPRVNHILYLKKRYNELKFHFGKTPLYIFDSQIIFLFLTKNPNLSNKLNRILESYKNTYGQLRLHYDQLR